MTFRNASANYLEWAKRTKLKKTARSANFWQRRERMLNEYVLPIIGDKPIAEIPAIMFNSLQESIRLTVEGTNEHERKEAMAAAMAVLVHHQTGR